MFFETFTIEENLKKKKVLNHYGGTKSTPTMQPLCNYITKVISTPAGPVTIPKPTSQGVMTTGWDPRGRRSGAKLNPKPFKQCTAATFHYLFNTHVGASCNWYFSDGWSYSWNNTDFNLFNGCPVPLDVIGTTIPDMHVALEWWNRRATRIGMGTFTFKVYLGFPTLLQVQRRFF
jgi:hypothetical protein